MILRSVLTLGLLACAALVPISGCNKAAPPPCTPANTPPCPPDDSSGSATFSAGPIVSSPADTDDRMKLRPAGLALKVRATLANSARRDLGRLRLEVGPEFSVSVRRTEPSEPEDEERGLRRDNYTLYGFSLYSRISYQTAKKFALGAFVAPGVGYRSAYSQDQAGILLTSRARAGLMLETGLTFGFTIPREDCESAETGLALGVGYFVGSGEQLVSFVPQLYVNL